MLWFCAGVGVLLAGSTVAFYAVLARVVRAQFDRRLLEAASPVAADFLADRDIQDIAELDLPGQYFELLGPSGRIVALSKNLREAPLPINVRDLGLLEPAFRTIQETKRGPLRLILLPVHLRQETQVLVLAMPTLDMDLALQSFRRMILLLLPFSLLLTAAVSAWYVGRSLRPVAELTRQAALMTERLRGSPAASRDLRQSLWTPLDSPNPRDELGRLAETFNELFARVDSALRQLRQFVSDASHELRTPLSVLQGETELLLSEPRSAEEYQKTLKVIDGELKKLSHIVQGLFTLAMADAGQLHLDAEPIYLHEVLA